MFASKGPISSESRAGEVHPFPRRLLAASFALVALGLTLASLAWACTMQAEITVTPAANGSATVTGKEFVNGGPVEIHLDSAEGPIVARATGPTFGPIEIRVQTPGTHYIVAIGMNDDRSIAGRAVGSFEVAPEASAPSPESEATAPEGSPSPGSQAAPPNSRGPARSPGRTTGRSPGREPSSTAPRSRSAPRRNADRPRGGSGPATRNRAPAATEKPASATSPAVRTKSGTVVFGGSIGSPAERSGTEPTKAGAGTERTKATAEPSERAPSLTGPRGSTDARDAGRAGPQLAIGLGLLGAGLVMLFAGFLVAAVRRDRRLAQASGRRRPR